MGQALALRVSGGGGTWNFGCRSGRLRGELGAALEARVSAEKEEV